VLRMLRRRPVFAWFDLRVGGMREFGHFVYPFADLRWW
jgi:hypothetical protein